MVRFEGMVNMTSTRLAQETTAAHVGDEPQCAAMRINSSSHEELGYTVRLQPSKPQRTILMA